MAKTLIRVALKDIQVNAGACENVHRNSWTTRHLCSAQQVGRLPSCPHPKIYVAFLKYLYLRF